MTNWPPGAFSWHSRINNISNAPQTHLVGGRQHVLVAVGDTLYAFVLPQVRRRQAASAAAAVEDRHQRPNGRRHSAKLRNGHARGERLYRI